MKAWLAGVGAIVLAGCAAPSQVEAPAQLPGPDVDIEVLAMQSRPLRVLPPAKKVEEKEPAKPKPRRKRRQPKPKPKVPPDEIIIPARVREEPPIDIPADSPDVGGEVAKEFDRRDRERRRRQSEGE